MNVNAQENLQFMVIGIKEECMTICSASFDYLDGHLPSKEQIVRAFVKQFDFIPDYVLVGEINALNESKVYPAITQHLTVNAFDEEKGIFEIKG